jgi:RHS repeat-associated protein
MLRDGTASYYHQDGLGTITSLSNSSGVLAETYTYDSYGKTTASTGTLVNPFQYTGREFDSETGIYYYRARYFDPSAGRFLSEDSVRFGAGPNFYRYAGNSPLNWIDPSGNASCWSVTPNGMTQVQCSGGPGGSGDCGGGTGPSCTIPMPAGPPSAPLPDDPYAPGCKCDVKAYARRLEKIIEEEEAENDAMLPWTVAKSAGSEGFQWVLEGFGIEGLWGPVVDSGFLVLDLVEIEKHHDEALEKWRRVDEEWYANCH